MGKTKDQRKEHIPLFYRWIQVLARLAMAIFFVKIELGHRKNIPESGPVLFVANHPNSAMDALVLSAAIKRLVHYLAHTGLFANKIRGWLLRGLGVIPVYRRSEETDKAERNVEAFCSCYQALEKGGALGIFPEGISGYERRVRRIKTGAARIALEAERRNSYRLGVKIIPVGIYFFSRSRFRSKAFINVGKPLDLEPFFELNEKDNFEAVRQLTEEIQRCLEHLTVNIRHVELDQFVKEIESIYKEELLRQGLFPQQPGKSTVAEFFITQKIAECVDYYYDRDPKRVRDFQEKIRAYKRKLKRLHLRDAQVKEKASLSRLIRADLANVVKAIIGSPAAIYGIINNFLPYRITELIAKKYLKERTKILTALFLGGGAAFILFYSAQVFLVWHLGGALWAVLYLLSLPVSGFFALAYIRKIRQMQEYLSFSFFIFTKRYLLGKMRYARQALIAEMNAIKEEYMKIANLQPPADKSG